MTKENPRVGGESLSSGPAPAYGPRLATVGHRRRIPRSGGSGPRASGRESRAGRALALLALLTVGAAAALGGLWLWISSGSNGVAPLVIDDRSTAADSAGSPGELPLPAPGPEDGPAVADTTESSDAAKDPLRFEGRGSIRGQVAVGPGIVFPDRYAVVVGPSRHVIGGERATSKRVEFPGTAEEFRVDDLPLGDAL